MKLKKLIVSSVVGLIIAGALAFTGCNVDPSQVNAVAQQAGLFAAVGFIAYDNPDQNAMTVVRSLLTMISDKSKSVSSGKTYSEVVLPDITAFINSSVDAQYKPIANAGAISLLGAIDMMFVIHPSWKTDQNIALGVVNSFISGANSGLGLSDKSPILVQARSTANARARSFKAFHVQ